MASSLATVHAYITGFAEINFKSFKLLGRDKNTVKTKVASKITQFDSK